MIDNPFNSGNRLDSITANALSGLGETERANYDYILPYLQLGESDINRLVTNPFIYRCIAAMPDAATKKGWTLSFSDDVSYEKNKEINAKYLDYHSRLKTKYKLNRADFTARLTSGACIIIDVDDGRHYSEPINEKNIRTIKRLLIRDRYKIRPHLVSPEGYLILDPIEDVDHYWIGSSRDKFFHDNQGKSNDQKDYLIHESRILRFDGIVMSDNFMLNNSGWGLSITESVYPYFKQWDKALTAIAEIIETASVLTYSLQGLADLIRDENANGLLERFKSIKLMMSVFNGIALDAQSEKIDYVSRSFNGLENVAAIYRDAFIGASGEPHTVIFGDSAGGLGSTGESEENTRATAIASHQSTIYQPLLNRLDDLIFLAKDGPTKGKNLEGRLIQFIPWKEETTIEKQANRSTDVNILATALQSGIVTPDEARTVLGDPHWWPQLQLDTKEWKKQKEKAEQNDQGNPYGDPYSQFEDPQSQGVQDQQPQNDQYNPELEDNQENKPDNPDETDENPGENDDSNVEENQEEESPQKKPKKDSTYDEIDWSIPQNIRTYLRKSKDPGYFPLAKQLSITPAQVKVYSQQIKRKKGRISGFEKWIKNLQAQIEDSEIESHRGDSELDPQDELIDITAKRTADILVQVQDSLQKAIDSSKGNTDSLKYASLSSELANYEYPIDKLQQQLFEGILLSELAGRLETLQQSIEDTEDDDR